MSYHGELWNAYQRRQTWDRRSSTTRRSPTAQRRENMARIIPGIPQWLEDQLLQAGGTALSREGGAYPAQAYYSPDSANGNFDLADGTYLPGGRNIQITGSGPGGRVYGRPRRRRKRLLTCSDKADIAFLHGQLGGGQMGRAAISSLLSRRCG
jgi:hypothetical protein